jgi:hypothetical protein
MAVPLVLLKVALRTTSKLVIIKATACIIAFALKQRFNIMFIYVVLREKQTKKEISYLVTSYDYLL